MKERMVESVPDLDQFHLGIGDLSHSRWVTGYERWQQADKAGHVPISTVKAWMERLPELMKGYLLKYTLYMDERGLFFNTMPQKGLLEKGKKRWEGKPSKKRCTIALFVDTNGSKVCGPIFVWRSKSSRWFRNLTNISYTHGANYFSSAKAWMTTKVMKEVLRALDKKMIAEGRKVLLFLDMAPFHPNFLQESLKT